MSFINEIQERHEQGTAGFAAPAAETESRRVFPGVRLLRWASSHPDVTIAVILLVVVVLWAVIPSLFAPTSPDAIDPASILKGPSGAHWFGTDNLGRDMFSRVVYGARASLIGSVVAISVGFLIGSAIGSIAGWFGGGVETALMRAIDVILAIPFFLLVVTIVVLLGFGTVHAALAVGLATSAIFARLIRGEVLKVRASQYVEAAVAGGVGPWSILRRHVIPNSLSPALSLVTVQLGVAIIWLASLSFLGFGAQPPTPEWGLLVSEGRNYIAANDWWLVVFPALAIVITVMATNRIGHYMAGRED
jgi:peptide/nickel transport system permease protein